MKINLKIKVLKTKIWKIIKMTLQRELWSFLKLINQNLKRVKSTQNV